MGSLVEKQHVLLTAELSFQSCGLVSDEGRPIELQTVAFFLFLHFTFLGHVHKERRKGKDHS